MQYDHLLIHISTGQNMLFHFYINIAVMLNKDGTLFHPYFKMLFPQKLFKTLK